LVKSIPFQEVAESPAREVTVHNAVVDPHCDFVFAIPSMEVCGRVIAVEY